MVDALQIVLAILVASLMLGLGATLTAEQLKHTWRHGKMGVGIGFLSQFLILPLSTWALAHALDVDNVTGTSMVIVAASPGGSTSNLFSYYADLDVGLSITMTALSTMLALGFMPLNTYIYTRDFTDDDIKVDYGSMVVSLLLVLVPVAAGVYVKHRSDLWASRVERFGSLVGVLFILAALIYGSVSNAHIFSSSWQVYIAAVAMVFYGAGFGWSASRVARLGEKQARTVALETGIQNSTLSLAVISLSFPNDTPAEEDLQEDLFVFPLLYSVFLIIDAALLTLLFRVWPAPQEAPAPSAGPTPAEEGDSEPMRQDSRAVPPQTDAIESPKSTTGLAAVEISLPPGSANPLTAATGLEGDREPAEAAGAQAHSTTTATGVGNLPPNAAPRSDDGTDPASSFSRV